MQRQAGSPGLRFPQRLSWLGHDSSPVGGGYPKRNGLGGADGAPGTPADRGGVPVLLGGHAGIPAKGRPYRQSHRHGGNAAADQAYSDFH